MPAPHAFEQRAGAGLRLMRAVVFAAVCVVLSAGGHALASSHTVPLWTVGVGFLASLGLVVPFAGRARSLPGIAAALAAGQLALHVVFGAGQHGAAAAAQGWPPADASLIQRASKLVCGAGAAVMNPAEARRILTVAGMNPDTPPTGHEHHHSMAMGASPEPAVESGGTGLLPDVPMLLGHLLAALAAGWLLRRGDLALLRLVELSAVSRDGLTHGAPVRALCAALALVRALVRGPVPDADALALSPPTAPRSAPTPRTETLADTVIRRGPPAPSGPSPLTGACRPARDVLALAA
ncbi:hypothetical protein DSC45_26830 [Streptomyces sp. YIM 130001]|uniref:hypothetical protein n=1 Tax=Streptomyces sp. YIM 130001 TaxID=2259644 RepID=UPI000E64A719|nr:hypothetical protein [Streptomyces sp. YIM 130001]RII11917.1 hypothetical protein DSC45_26830 [Streptomyces sp. YIM 130001]